MLFKKKETPLQKLRAMFDEQKYELAVVEARRLFREKQITKQEEIPVMQILGESYLNSNNAAAATQVFQKLRERDPDSFEYSLKLCQSLINQKKIAPAESLVSDLEKTRPSHHRVLYFRGVLWYLKKNYSKVAEFLDQSVKANKKFLSSSYYLGLALIKMESFAEAIPYLKRAAHDRRLAASCYYHIGFAFFRQDAILDAIAFLESVLKMADSQTSRSYLEMRYLLGQCYEVNNNTAKALVQYKKVASVQRSFKEVQSKISYFSKNVHDRVADYETASKEDFTRIARVTVTKVLKYEIADVQLKSDSELLIFAKNNEGKAAILFIRSQTLLVEKILTSWKTDYVKDGVNELILFYTGELSPNAVKYARREPITVYDKKRVSQILEEYEFEVEA